jgi:hypothetical protein
MFEVGAAASSCRVVIVDQAEEKEEKGTADGRLAAAQMSCTRMQRVAAGNLEEEGFVQSCSDVESGHSFQTHAKL